MSCRSGNGILWIVSFACLSVVACVRSVDISKVKCEGKSTCPTNYFCNMDYVTWGRCVQGVAAVDSGNGGGGGSIDAQHGEVSSTGGLHDSGVSGDVESDAPMATGGSGGDVYDALGSGGVLSTGGILSTGGSTSSGTQPNGSGGVLSTGGILSTGGSTSSGTQPKGSSCTSDAQCASGLYCVDGVCCASKCDGQCQACNEADSVGTCKIVQGAPRGARTTCPGSGKCQGQCDGTNASGCLMPGTSTTCKEASCANGSATAASTCNGSGACGTPVPKACATNLCATDGSGVCAGSCTATSCPTGSYCDPTGNCATKKPSGTGNTCSTSAECSNGHCSVEGLCCNSDCTGQCQSCNNPTGTCSRVNSGQPVGGRAACTQAGTACGGTCDGTSDTACHYPGVEKTCGTATCSTDSASTITPACNGSGACASATSSCGASAYCSGGSCTPKGSGSCTSNIQCTSGNCLSNLCCASGLVNSNGVCCASGLTGCAGQCVNTNTNSTYCGSCTKACAAGLSCNSGTCACTKGAPACGGCLAWDFEWGSNPSPWSLELTAGATSPNGATNIGITQSKYNSGASSLIAPILIDAINTHFAEVTVSLPCKTNLSGYSGWAYVYFAGDYPLTDFANQLIVDTWNSSGTGGDHVVPYFGNIPTNGWFKLDLGFTSSVQVDRIGITLAPASNWTGTMYVDDVVINGL